MSEHSPTPWRDALDRLHYHARCNENRWHSIPLNADRDKEAVFLAHDKMVDALRELRAFLLREHAETDPTTGDVISPEALPVWRLVCSALATATQVHEEE